MKKQEAAYALYEEGYRYEVIADRLSISSNAARVHVCNARKARGLPRKKGVGSRPQRKLIPFNNGSDMRDMGEWKHAGTVMHHIVEGLE